MDFSEDLININVNICDRPYRLKIKPSEEEYVRKAAKQVNEKVKELQKQYTAKDKQDYLAMTALMYLVDKLNDDKKFSIGDEHIIGRLSEIDLRLDQVLNS